MRTKIFFFYPLFFLIISFKIIGQPSSEYRLVFSDEFNDGIIDEVNNWKLHGNGECSSHALGDPECEASMWYIPENIVEEDGYLKIISKEESYECNGKIKEYTSGLIETRNSFLYGYYEVHCQIPKGSGMWPAFWGWSGIDGISYEEIDVFEFCGCNCKKYRTGYYYEDTYNMNIGDDIKHNSSDLKIEKDNHACYHFNTYGVEWTPAQINFYFNGKKVYSDQNINNHKPLPWHLNTAVEGCYGGCGMTYCGNLHWEYNGKCQVNCETEFPAVFRINWIKGWQKEGDAIRLSGAKEMCVGDTVEIFATDYPNTNYEWTVPSGLEIDTSLGLKFYENAWKKRVKIIGDTPGKYAVSVTASFPSGYAETKNHTLEVWQSPPSSLTTITLASGNNNCCFNLITNDLQNAFFYHWKINEITDSSATNIYSVCHLEKNLNVEVIAKNACGSSPVLSENIPENTLSGCKTDPLLILYPNPAKGILQIKLMDHQQNTIHNVSGDLQIRDFTGHLIFENKLRGNPETIDVSSFSLGVYFVIFFNEEIFINTKFLIAHE